MMRKVLIYARRLLPYSQTFICEQARAMRIWCPLLVGESLVPDGLALDGLKIRLFCPVRENFVRRQKRRLYRRLGWPNRHDLALLRAENPSLLHIHFGTEASLLWPLARILSIPVLVTLHGYDINIHREWYEAGHGGKERLNYPRQLLAMSRHPCVHFIAVSDAIRQRAIEYGLPAEKINVHYIGVDTERFCPGPVPLNQRPPRVLFVGRQVEKKGCELLIQAFVRVQEHLPGAQLVVIGDGPLLTKNKALAAELGVNAEFLGVLSPSEVRSEMDCARIFCLPSIVADNGDAEGLPISILEAQACGVPVVITKSGGSNEAIDEGKTGFLIEKASSADIAVRIVELLSNDLLLEHLGSNARSFVERKFNIQHCTANLEAFFLNIQEKCGRRLTERGIG